MKQTILALVILAAATGSADAQLFGRRHFSGGSCAPSYSYAPSYAPTYYAPTYEQVTYREVVIPLLQPYPLFVDPRISYHYLGGNGSVALGSASLQLQPPGVSALQQQMTAPAQSSTKQDVDIDALIDRIEKRVRERNQQSGISGNSSNVAYEPDGPPTVPDVSYSQVKAPSRNWAQVLQTNCALCHTGDKSKGNFVIFASPGRVSPTFDSQAAWEAIKEGRMPPKERPRIRADDKELLRRDFGI